MAEARARFERTGEKQRLFADLSYAAKTRGRERRVIARLEHGEKGANPRYVVTNLAGDGDDLYDRLCPESRPSSGKRPLSWRGGPLYLGQPTPLGEICQDRF